MTDQKYFNDYADTAGNHYNFRGIFIKQRELCEKYHQLQIGGINHLTLRLCLVQHEFCNLFKQTLEVRQKTRQGDYLFEYAFRDTATSGVVGMVAIPNKESGNAGESVDIGLHNIHQYFYSFCTFAVGVLDRLAVEVRECYDLKEIGEYQIDWGFLFKQEDKKVLERVKNKNIYSILNDPRNDFSQLRDKRNTLEHRNFFEIKPNEGGSNFDYVIEGNIFLTAFTKEQFTKILSLCNDVYEAIYKDAEKISFDFPVHL